MRPIRLYTVVGEGRIRRPRLRRSRVICTVATGAHVGLLDIALPSLRAYANRHHFDLVAVRHDTAFGRPVAWGKLPIIHGLLNASYKLVVWIDADAIIVNLEPNIADEVRPGKDLYLVEHYFEPSGEATANTGVMMIRAGDWARQLLAAAWARTDLIQHQWWENAAIMQLLGYRTEVGSARPERDTEWRERTQLLDLAWNSTPRYVASPNPIINHYGSLPLEERRAGMLADLGALAMRQGLRPARRMSLDSV
jgi:hypothetical protein